MKITNDYIKGLLSQGKRIDSRKPDEFRDITIEQNVIGNADGSARVKIGNTEVIAGVKMSIGTPYPDKMDEGVLMTGAELSPLASPDFESGPPSEDAIELARVIDRGIRESKMIDTKKLCVEKGEKVWMVSVDIQIINHDGNLLDCGSIAAVSALLCAKFPKFDGETVEFGTKSDKSLPVTCKPVAVTFYKIGDNLIVDPSIDEEKASTVKITVTTKDDGNISAMQKSGSDTFSFEEVSNAFDQSVKIGSKVRKLLK